MEITKNEIDNLNAEVKIKISPDDYEDKVTKILKDYRKRMNMPGFRPGMVPMGIVRKQYGMAVLGDELNKMLSNSLHEYINKEKLEVLGNPLPKDGEQIDIEADKEFEFTYNLGIAPQFKAEISDKDKFTKYVIQVDDKLLGKYVADVQKRYGKVNPADKAGENDLINGKFEELDSEGKLVENGITHTSTISIEYVEDEAIKKNLLGMVNGDTIIVDPRKVSKGGADTAAMLNVTTDQVNSVSDKFKFTVENIYHMTPADLNQELFDKAFGEGEVKSEEEFKAKISDELALMLSQDAARKLKIDISDHFIKKLKLQLPDEFLKRWLNETKEDKEKDVDDAEYEKYAEGLRWRLIEDKIIKENKVEVKPEEALELVKQRLADNMLKYGYPAPEEELLTKHAQEILTKEEEARQIYSELYDERLMKLYEGTFAIKDKEVSFDEFVDIVQKKNEKNNILGNINKLLKFK